MRDGFIKAAAAAPDIKVADCISNTQEIIKKAREMSSAGARIMVFPELCITTLEEPRRSYVDPRH